MPPKVREADNLATRLEKRLDHARFAGKHVLLERLEQYKKGEKKRQEEEMQKSGHFFLQENVEGIQGFLEKREAERREAAMRSSTQHATVVQQRNARQYNILQKKMEETREAKNLKKLRVEAMGEFIMRSALNKADTRHKSWLAMCVTARTHLVFMEKLQEHRKKVAHKAKLAAMTAIAFFFMNKFRQRKRRRCADELIGFLRFIQRDGQIKRCERSGASGAERGGASGAERSERSEASTEDEGCWRPSCGGGLRDANPALRSRARSIAKKLQWVLMKLQKLMKQHQQGNAAQVVMIGKKYELVVATYLETEAKKREAIAARAKKNPGKGKNRIKVPEEKMPLDDRFKQKQLADWVIKNRQL
jgi:hypothetical protein